MMSTMSIDEEAGESYGRMSDSEEETTSRYHTGNRPIKMNLEL